MPEVPIREGPIGTLNDLLDQMQQEIQDVKSGQMAESQARVTLGYRKGQLKIAELGLQYLRLVKPRTGSIKGAVPILPGAAEQFTAAATGTDNKEKVSALPSGTSQT